jgi:hypothetical protein
MLVLVACGDDAASSTTTTTVLETTTSSLATTTTSSLVTTTSTTAATTTTAPATSTTDGGSELPGEPTDFGPVAGDTLAVVGVAHDDVLNLRAAPGADQEILEGIPPTYDALIALGQARELPQSLWIGVDYEGTEGWVNLSFIGYLGDTTDITHTVSEQLGGTPGAETMLELGLTVAEGIAGDPSADIVMSVAPSVGDLGEVTFDVTGIEDDSVRGSRLHVFGQPIDEAFLLASVEGTVICARGVDDGACV